MNERRTSHRRSAQMPAAAGEYELEENTPPPVHGSGRRSSRHSASHTAEIDYGDGAPSFMGRWLAAIIGSMLAWGTYDLVLWDSFKQSSQSFLAESEIAAWQNYSTAIIGAVVASAIVGLFIAAFDKSRLRSLIMGMGMFGIAALIMTCVQVLNPLPAMNNNDAMQASAGLLHISLLPVMADQKQDIRALQDRAKALEAELATARENLETADTDKENLETARSSLEEDLARAQEVIKEHQTAAEKHREMHTLLKQQHGELIKKLEQTTNNLEKERQEQAALLSKVTELENSIIAEQKKVTALQQEVKDAKRAIQKQKEMEAMEKLGNTPDQQPKAPGVE